MFRTLTIGLVTLTSSAALAADWPQFRGSDSTAIARGVTLPARIGPAGADWKVSLPGRGLSGPIVVGDRVFLSSSSGYKQGQLHVLGFSAQSGEKLWQRTFWATGPALCHPKTCMAAPTPASDGRHIVALFATNDVACLDLDGNLEWVRSLYEENPGATDCRGLASSPLIVAGTAIVQMDNQNNSFAVGIDVATGKNRWHMKRPRDISWTTPILLPGQSPGAELVLLQGATALFACDPVTGREAWRLKRDLHPIASSVLAGDILYVPGAAGLAAFQLQPFPAPPKLLWEKTKLNPDVASPLAMDGRLYVLKGSILVSADAKTGEVQGQLRLKGPFSSSMVSAGGLLYCFNEEGLAQVVKPDAKDGTVLDSSDFKEKILCTPAIARGALFVRSDEHLWKIGKS
jgi:outer membrane protein assembly factor BamB